MSSSPRRKKLLVNDYRNADPTNYRTSGGIVKGRSSRPRDQRNRPAKVGTDERDVSDFGGIKAFSNTDEQEEIGDGIVGYV